MRLSRFGRGPGYGASLPKRSPGRWIVVALGLGVLVAALVGAAGPYRQTREFCEVAVCGGHADDRLDKESGSIVGRRIIETTSTDADGHPSTTTHYEVTWQRADGSQQIRLVSSGFYSKAKEQQPVVLHLWHGDIVGAEVMGGEERFLPHSGETLGNWLYMAHFGLGVVLWGLLFGWWDGFFMLAVRTFIWMLVSFVPVHIATNALAYGVNIGPGLALDVVGGLFFIGVAGWMLLGSLERW